MRVAAFPWNMHCLYNLLSLVDWKKEQVAQTKQSNKTPKFAYLTAPSFLSASAGSDSTRIITPENIQMYFNKQNRSLHILTFANKTLYECVSFSTCTNTRERDSKIIEFGEFASSFKTSKQQER